MAVLMGAFLLVRLLLFMDNAKIKSQHRSHQFTIESTMTLDASKKRIVQARIKEYRGAARSEEFQIRTSGSEGKPSPPVFTAVFAFSKNSRSCFMRSPPL